MIGQNDVIILLMYVIGQNGVIILLMYVISQNDVIILLSKRRYHSSPCVLDHKYTERQKEDRKIFKCFPGLVAWYMSMI